MLIIKTDIIINEESKDLIEEIESLIKQINGVSDVKIHAVEQW